MFQMVRPLGIYADPECTAKIGMTSYNTFTGQWRAKIHCTCENYEFLITYKSCDFRKSENSTIAQCRQRTLEKILKQLTRLNLVADGGCKWWRLHMYNAMQTEKIPRPTNKMKPSECKRSTEIQKVLHTETRWGLLNIGKMERGQSCRIRRPILLV